MEAISTFLKACESLGVPNSDIFMTVDLYEAKALFKVYETLAALKRVSK